MTNEVGDTGIGALFASDTLVRVLSAFLLHPERRYYQAELAQRTGARLYLVQRVLQRLQRAGLVERSQEGRRIYYSACRNNPGFEDLKRLFMKTVLVGDALRTALGDHRPGVDLAFVYGSVAEGVENAGSDLDLFMVGSISAQEASGVGTMLQERVGREVNVTAFDLEELRERLANDDAFITSVVMEPKIWLIGDEDELARLGSGR